MQKKLLEALARPFPSSTLVRYYKHKAYHMRPLDLERDASTSSTCSSTSNQKLRSNVPSSIMRCCKSLAIYDVFLPEYVSRNSPAISKKSGHRSPATTSASKFILSSVLKMPNLQLRSPITKCFLGAYCLKSSRTISNRPQQTRPNNGI